jgi:hypothetical protein
MAQALNRRHLFRLMAGAPLLAAAPALAAKAEKTAAIVRLIAESRALPHVSERIDFISGKLLGTRYQGDTLIGSPKRPEQFVVRDDAFDCVTYCEVVLAAALAHDPAEFEAELRRIRYDGGEVSYNKRNHYFADWCQRNIDNGVCRRVAIEPSVTFEKTLTWHREFDKHPVSITAIDKTTMLDKKALLAPGDIIGFVSRRAGLDYYHTGLIAFARNGDLLLRSAALSKGRALDQKMTAFVTSNPVKYVTLLRAAEPAPMVERR